MFEGLSAHGSSAGRIAGGWIIAGLLLIALMGVSVSEPEAPAATGAAAPFESPTYAIDEELAPLGAG